MVTVFKNLPNASKNEEQMRLLYIVGGRVNCYSHFGKYLAVSYKVTHTGAEGEGQGDYKSGNGKFLNDGIVLFLNCGSSFLIV